MGIETIPVINFTKIGNTLDFLFLKITVDIWFILLLGIFMSIIDILYLVHLVVELIVDFTVVEE